MSGSANSSASPDWRTHFRAIGFDALAGWTMSAFEPAFRAFRRSAPALVAGSLRDGALGLDASAFGPAAEAILAAEPEPGSEAARRFFERFFRPARIQPNGTPAPGFVTGYYEPEVAASLHETARFRVPLYRPPPDLVAVEEGDAPDGVDPTARFARRTRDGRLTDYPDRAAIEGGLLAGQGLELAYLASAVDAFFIHVQGSARLRLPDGKTQRVGYAAKNGHRFTAIGRVLVNEGELALAEADMAGIRRWLAAHPERATRLLHRNRSFIFFRDVPIGSEADGPVGAAGVSLTPLGSLAVDQTLHTYGTPIFVDAPTLRIDDAPFRRLLIAQDTGSAILGPTRGDIFVGSGETAGQLAGRVREAAEFTALLPIGLLDGRAR